MRSRRVHRLLNHLHVLQEQQMGRDRMDVAKLLQRHKVIVKGGPQEGRKLLDALVVSTRPVGPVNFHSGQVKDRSG